MDFVKGLSRRLSYATLFCILVQPVQGFSASLDFGIKSPTTGSLSYTGGSAALVGSGIDVDDVVGLGTPANANVISTCSFCTLDFTTGASTGGWNFGAGGTITITGGIDFPDATAPIPGGSTLLSGSFDSATIVDLGTGTFEFQIAGGAFTDTKNSELLAFYGLPDVLYAGGLNISFSTAAAMGDAFDSNELFSGDVVNQPVPLPAAVWLFGSGLLGFTMVGRRRTR
jgi:hypothetical protein